MGKKDDLKVLRFCTAGIKIVIKGIKKLAMMILNQIMVDI